MKILLQKFSLISTLVILCFTINLAQENNEKSKPTLEQGKITIKVKNGIGPFQKQTGTISFGINSLDQKSEKYQVNKLTESFIHKPIPQNSGLPDLSRIYQIEFPIKYNVVIVSQEFSQDPSIEYAEPIPVNYLLEEPNDSLYNEQWYLHKVQSDSAWDIHKGEDGDSVIILSIIDTGCWYVHPDIAQNIWNNLGEDFDGDGKTFEWNGSAWVFDPDDINNIDDDGNGFVDDFIGWNFVNNNNNPNDGYFHGTVVSGIAGATTNNFIGVASISYNVKIMPVKSHNDQGSGTNANKYNSIIYAAENGADVINCSWGGFAYSEANKEVIEYVDGLGSIIVAAAGNDNIPNPWYPACYPYVIGVAAIDSQNVKTPYSTYGAGVDVAAPGPQASQPFIVIGPGGYGYATLGTSFSSPIVTGLVGLIKSFHPTWTRDQIIKQLLYTTKNIDLINPGFENLLGTGKINAYHALVDSDLTITPELKINMTLLTNTLKGSSKVLYPNSVMNFSLRVQNYSHLLDANPLTISLTSNNPDVLIIDGDYTGLIAANSIVELLDEFQIEIASNAATAIATLSFNASANLPVVAGSIIEFNVIVNPNGTLVWEGVENGQDYSGEFIKNYLASNSFQFLYTAKTVLGSYNGLDAMFLSFGNYGPSGLSQTVFNDYHAAQVQEYLESGGKVYLEGGDALGFDQVGNSNLLSLFGLSSVNDGSTNIINSLEGQSDALTQEMLFTSSTQVNNTWIDKYYPNAMGTVSFYESGYANVAVQSVGNYRQRTFCFSYALAELVDENPPSTRDTLIQRILDFFEVEPLQLPSAPALISPLNSAVIDSASVLFVWQQIQPAVTKYWLELDTTDQFSTAFVDSTITDTTLLYSSLMDGEYWWRVKAFNAAGWGEFGEAWSFSVIITSVEVDDQLPIEYSLMQNYPNPFNPITVIKYSIPKESVVKLEILNILGEQVELLVSETKTAGSYEAVWNASNLSSGIYFYRIQAGSFVETKKMVLLR